MLENCFHLILSKKHGDASVDHKRSRCDPRKTKRIAEFLEACQVGDENIFDKENLNITLCRYLLSYTIGIHRMLMAILQRGYGKGFSTIPRMPQATDCRAKDSSQ